MVDNTVLRMGRDAPITPPRFVGNPAQDLSSTLEWMKQVTDALNTSGLGDPVYQFTVVPIDPLNPPDPASTTLARAQATANLALSIAREAKTLAES